MAIKVYKALPMYDEYLQYFYGRNDLREYSFDNHMNALRDDFFSSMDFNWSTFNEDDEIVIFETIENDFFLQQKYCNYKYADDPDWRKKIILQQIKDLQPHACIIYPPEYYNEDFLNQIRDIVQHKIIIGSYDGTNRENINLYSGYDFIYTCSKYISSYYEQHNIPTYALEFGFNPLILKKIINSSKKYKVGFSGSIFEGIHNQRLELLKYLVNKTPITIHSSLSLGKYSLLSRKPIRALKNGTFANYMALRKIKKINQRALYGLEMFQFLHDSKITLNQHGDKIKFAANIRLYEATGVGSCLLTDWKENLGELFELEKEVVTYRSKEEALDKIKFLLKHENIRKQIATQGQKRVLSMYSEAQRIPHIIKYIRDLM